MKTDKKIEEMKVKYQLEKWGKYIDGEVITFTWKEFFKMMDNYTPNTEVQKAREEAVREFVHWLENDAFVDGKVLMVVGQSVKSLAEEYLKTLKDKK